MLTPSVQISYSDAFGPRVTLITENIPGTPMPPSVDQMTSRINQLSFESDETSVVHERRVSYDDKTVVSPGSPQRANNSTHELNTANNVVNSFAVKRNSKGSVDRIAKQENQDKEVSKVILLQNFSKKV